MALFYELVDDTLYIGGTTWTGATENTATPPSWDWDAIKSDIVYIKPHDATVFDPGVTSLASFAKGCTHLQEADLSTIDLTNITTFATSDNNIPYGTHGCFDNCPMLEYVKLGAVPQSVSFGDFSSSGSNPCWIFTGAGKAFSKMTLEADFSARTNVIGLLMGGNFYEFEFKGTGSTALTNIDAIAHNNSRIRKIDISLFNFGAYLDCFGTHGLFNTGAFKNCTNLEYVKLPKLPATVDWGSDINERYCFGFAATNKILTIETDLSEVTSLQRFLKQVRAKGINIKGPGVSSACTNMEGMCHRAVYLETQPVMSGWDTSSVTNIGYMFGDCTALQIADLSNLDFRSVTTVGTMFRNTSALKYLSLNVPDVNDFGTSFLSGSSVTNQDVLVVNLNTIGAHSLKNFFNGSYAKSIFLKINKPELISDITNMFRNMQDLEKICCYADLSSAAGTDVFTGDTNLVGITTVYDASKVSSAYAKLDGGSEDPAYFNQGTGVMYVMYVNPGSAGKFKTTFTENDVWSSLCRGFPTLYDPGTIYRYEDNLTFEGWYEDGEKVGLGQSYDIVSPRQSNRIVVVVQSYVEAYKPMTSLKVEISPPRSGELSIEGDVEYGNQLTVTADPNDDSLYIKMVVVSPSEIRTEYSGNPITLNLNEMGEWLITGYFAGEGYDVGPYDPDVPLPDLPNDIITDSKPTNFMKYGDTGMNCVFVPTEEQLHDFADTLFGSNWMQNIAYNTLNISFTDIIYSLMVFPFKINPTGTKNIKVGWWTTGVDMRYTNKLYVEFDCGELTVPAIYNNALDYQTQVQIYLPFIDYKQLETYDVIGKRIQPIYQVDLVSGDCIVKVFIEGSCKYQFTGNVGYSIPITQLNNLDIGLKPMAALAGSIASGLITPAGSSVTENTKLNWSKSGVPHVTSVKTNRDVNYEKKAPIKTAIDAVGTFINMGDGAGRGGQLAGNSGFLSINTPHLLITRPNIAVPNKFGHMYGYPCNKYLKLGNCHGYTEVEAQHLHGIVCTDDELTEIDELLKGGVIL